MDKEPARELGWLLGIVTVLIVAIAASLIALMGTAVSGLAEAITRIPMAFAETATSFLTAILMVIGLLQTLGGFSADLCAGPAPLSVKLATWLARRR